MIYEIILSRTSIRKQNTIWIYREQLTSLLLTLLLAHILLSWGIMFYYILQAFWQSYLWWNRSNSQILFSSDFQWFLLLVSELSRNVLQFRQNTKSYMQMFISIHWDTAFLFLVLLKFRELELLFNPCWLYDVYLFVQWASCGFSFSKWSNGWCLFISSNWSTNLSFNTE